MNMRLLKGRPCICSSFLHSELEVNITILLAGNSSTADNTQSPYLYSILLLAMSRCTPPPSTESCKCERILIQSVQRRHIIMGSTQQASSCKQCKACKSACLTQAAILQTPGLRCIRRLRCKAKRPEFDLQQHVNKQFSYIWWGNCAAMCWLQAADTRLEGRV